MYISVYSSFIFQRITAHLHARKTPPYVLNLDPAVVNVPYPANIGKASLVFTFIIIVLSDSVYIHVCFGCRTILLKRERERERVGGIPRRRKTTK